MTLPWLRNKGGKRKRREGFRYLLEKHQRTCAYTGNIGENPEVTTVIKSHSSAEVLFTQDSSDPRK